MFSVAKLERDTVVGSASIEPVKVTLDDLIQYAETDTWEFCDFLSTKYEVTLDADNIDLTFD